MSDSRPIPPVTGPMGLGELLDRTVHVCRQAWLPLLLLGLLGSLPALIHPSAATTTQFDLFLRSANVVSTAIDSNRSLLFVLINTVANFLVGGALILVAAQATLGQPVSLRSALERAWNRFFAMWGTNLVAGLGYLGFMIILRLVGLISPSPYINLVLTVIGYLCLNLLFTFRGQALLLEELPGGSQPLKRSVTLVLQRFWPVTGLFLLLTIGSTLFAISWNGVVGLMIRPGEADLISAALVLLSRVLILPITTVGMTLLYYDTRVRLEGMDLVPSEPSA